MSMLWSDQRTRIRRMLRDPDGNIWADAYLLNLANDEQNDVQNHVGYNRDVKIVKTPPQFYSSYIYDFEYAYTDYDDGEVWQCFYEYPKDDFYFTHKWESQHIEGLTPTTSALGEMYTHPFEAWLAGTPAEPPPVILPDRFEKMLFVAWNKWPLDPTTKREVEMQDPSWRSRTGKPTHYWRNDDLENIIYLYPYISSLTWQDSETSATDDPDSSAYANTSMDVDDNLFVVFEKRPADLESGSDASDFPSFLYKYFEYGVISRAYLADTDGYIPSLSEYWNMRKQVGLKVLERFKVLKGSDRNYQLSTRRGPVGVRKRRHPRLPDDYPVIYP